MNIYFMHASTYPDYQQYLYVPIRQSEINNKYRIYFPHENDTQAVNSKNLIADCGLLIADVSYPSTGMGIELGWAENLGKQIVFVHQHTATPSASLRFISDNFLQYGNKEEMVIKLGRWLAENY